ncbi:hypothetical protein BGY98DRAFT_399034 [Russula aff. rugulosa BPL654]|nr:hypothetical protein BGY98DRAFT_399034 [Russula aff. rugulosa BPL654]
MHTAGIRCQTFKFHMQKDTLGRAVSPVIVRTFQLVIARCRHSTINIWILGTTSPTTVQDRLFPGPSQHRTRWKSLMFYTTSQPSPNIGYLQRKRHHLRVNFIRPSTQTSSMLLRHMFKFLFTLHCGSPLLCWFERGLHSTSHGLTLCTCNLSGRGAVMMLPS